MSTAVRKRAFHAVIAAAIALGVVSVAPAQAQATDPVMEWNDIARQLIIVPALSAVQQTRAMAIVHTAIHDAVNGVTNRYDQYTSTAPAAEDASPEAAAIAAAYGVLSGLFGSSPSQADFLAGKYAASLAAHGIASGDPGLAFGSAVAQNILAARQDDGAADAAFRYLPKMAGRPGVWTPMNDTPAAQALLPGWGDVAPFVLRNGSQFRPDAPPAVDSDIYARDYNEIYEIGALASATRTNEQTQIALFWRASPAALWNPILRQAINSRPPDLSSTARTMALFYLAASDASVACWNAKYHYNFWRPEPAIVRGDEDGNAATAGDPAWHPRIPTPPHPEYPSGHTTNSSAMAGVLAAIFGDAPGFVIEATSSQNAGFVRHWQTFSEGVDEVIDARVYSGIHFRNSDEVGAQLGYQIADFVMKHALRPVKKP